MEAVAHTPLPAEKMKVSGSSSSQTVPANFISGAAPAYPIPRVQRGESGVVVSSFKVDERGRTADFRVEKTNYRFFASHAVAAVRKSRYFNRVQCEWTGHVLLHR